MSADITEIKQILERLARNVATLAATVDALEKSAKRHGWNSKELLELHKDATSNLAIVFEPLFEAIDQL